MVKERELAKYMGKTVLVEETCVKWVVDNPTIQGRLLDELQFTKLVPTRAGWVAGYVNIRLQGFVMKQDLEENEGEPLVDIRDRPYRDDIHELEVVPCWRIVFWPTLLPVLARTEDCHFNSSALPVSTSKYEWQKQEVLIPESAKRWKGELREIMAGYARDKQGRWIKPSLQKEMEFVQKDGLMSER